MDTLTLPTALAVAIDRYLAHRRALGRGYCTEARVLASLQGFVAAEGAEDLNAPLFERWCQSQLTLTANVRRAHQRIVRNFCLYRARTEPGGFVPDLHRFPKPNPMRRR